MNYLPLDWDWYNASVLPFLSQDGDCLFWVRSVNSSGHGQVWYPIAQKLYLTHKVVYLMTKGSYDQENLELEHICERHRCVKHIQPTLHILNMNRDGTKIRMSRSSHNNKKTQCPQGHDYNFQNTYIDDKGRRYCRTCRSIRIKRARIEGTYANRPYWNK